MHHRQRTRLSAATAALAVAGASATVVDDLSIGAALLLGFVAYGLIAGLVAWVDLIFRGD